MTYHSDTNQNREGNKTSHDFLLKETVFFQKQNASYATNKRVFIGTSFCWDPIELLLITEFLVPV